MKILVIGFQRSGTTLLKDLIWKHPEVKHMFHEITLLRHTRGHLFSIGSIMDQEIKNNYQGVRKYNKKINFSMKYDTWGEKIPYYGMKAKRFKGWPTKYCRLWNNYFGGESRILHIIRNPIDVGISTKNRGFSRGLGRPIKIYKDTMNTLVNYFPKNVKHVQFENLLMDSEGLLKRIFNFCNLDSSKETINEIINNKDIFRFGKINKERAYGFMRVGEDPKKHKVRNILKQLNKLKGINYDLSDF